MEPTTYPILDHDLPLRLPVRPRPDEFAAATDSIWRTAGEKVVALTERHPDRFPLYTRDGRWIVDGEAWTNWCEGFLGGQLWLLALRSDDSQLRRLAEHYSTLIEHRRLDREVHDLGFLFWSTWRRWYDETGDQAKDDTVVEAGVTMSKRFNERGRFLRSFLAADSLFIDIMMNVGIIFHAARRTGDTELARIATEHCLTTRRYLVRGDGSASHEGIFDLDDGTFLRQTTQQGARDDGSWARGQAWALYGFGTAHRMTGDRRFLATAEACADFYIDRTGDALVPPNDWEHPDLHPIESSAAAIAGGGLWQLAGLTDDPVRAERYADYALATIERLAQPDLLASDDPTWEGVLRHGIYHSDHDLGVGESVMWGDYWLLDAVDMIERTARWA